jgi:serine protease Do
LSRFISARRAVLTATVGLTAAALLIGCSAPTITAPPTPTNTGFAGIGDDPQPLETGDPVVPTDPATEGFTSLTDDYGVLSIQVPSAWTDVNGEPFTSDDGQEWASIVASTDINQYFSDYSVSGMDFAGSPVPEGLTPDQLASFLDTVSGYFLSDCDVLEQGSAYDDGYYVGYQSSFENCGGIDSEGFAIVAVDNASTHLVFLRAQIAGADDPAAVYNVLASTFQSSISRAAAK